MMLTERQWELIREGNRINEMLGRFQVEVADPATTEEVAARYMTEGVRLALRLVEIAAILRGEIVDADA
jgi:hypothetical protein